MRQTLALLGSYCREDCSTKSNRFKQRVASHLPGIGLAANLVPRQGIAVDVGDLRGELPHHLALVRRDQPLLRL